MHTDQALATHFRTFAAACRDQSPLYERLALAIADDPALLALARQPLPGQPPPNMLFAAVHDLLLAGEQHQLAQWYATVGGGGVTGDPLPAFRAFCLTHADAIRALVATRRTQTNVVGRCAYLLPLFAWVARWGNGQPLALVEVGASAGLNLNWDRYRYSYGDGPSYGPADSVVQIVSEWRGPQRPTLPATTPTVAFRAGIELNPLDVRDPAVARWLLALSWPEDVARAEQLRQAIALAQAAPPPVVAGDALELLPQLLADVPPDSALCIYHTHVTYQFTPENRERLARLVAAHSAGRDLCYVAVEQVGAAMPRVELTGYRGGVAQQQTLAQVHYHGRWVEWLGEA